MRRIPLFAFCLGFFCMTVFHSPSFAEVKIMLKNGRTFIADNCREMNGKILCETMGGSFEFDKQAVENLKGITLRKYDGPSETPEAISDNKQADAVKKPGKEEDRAWRRKRLEEISMRKEALIAERAKLTQDREALNKEFGDQAYLLKPEVFETYQRRFNDLDVRINRFNDEANALNKEEQGLLDGLKIP